MGFEIDLAKSTSLFYFGFSGSHSLGPLEISHVSPFEISYMTTHGEI